jgi:hypothetical protein
MAMPLAKLISMLTPKRRSHWVFWAVFAIVAGFLCWMGWQMRTMQANQNEARRIRDTIGTLRDRRPNDVGPEEWNVGVDWADTACCNVCFSLAFSNPEANKRFGDALDEKIKANVDATILDWIWDQLELTGPLGKRYNERFRAAFHEQMQAVRKQ